MAGPGGLEVARYSKVKRGHGGLFSREYLDDLQVQAKCGPPSDWVPPTSLPDLRQHKRVALDIENKDTGLAEGRGSSWPMGTGHISGVALAWDGGALYAPTAHPDTECLDPQNVADWIRDHDRAGVQFITHHGSHDWGWLGTCWDIPVPEHIGDTEAAACAVDENRLAYSLDDLCRWRGIPGKDERMMREAARTFGIDDVKSNMHRLPGRYVGPYATQDAVSTFGLYESLLPELEAQDLMPAYQLEMDILPMVLAMRRRGIRINLAGAYQAIDTIQSMLDEHLRELARRLGEREVVMEQLRSNQSLVKWMDAEGIKYPYTPPTRGHPRGQPSFTGGKLGWMTKHEHWLPQLVSKAEALDMAINKFIKGYIVGYNFNGRLHASINQYRGEEGGTRTFRFSYSDPPLQQMPARDDFLAPLIRGLFLPEEGELWAASDYSQQEYRLIVHFAYLLKCRRAAEAVKLYNDDPSTDFHILVSEWTGLDRKPAKDTNFAKAFGAGRKKFAAMIGKTEEEASAIYDQYDEELPFVSQVSKEVKKVADRRGYIRLLDGARSHFDLWEPSWRERDEPYHPARPLAQAKDVWGDDRRLRRAFTHKGLSRLIQGSAARQTKMAMRECYRAGLIPLVQMHDELGHSISSPRDGRRVQELMRDAVQLSVPMKVDCEVGPTWGEATTKIDDYKG